jgi:hypothetical protein
LAHLQYVIFAETGWRAQCPGDCLLERSNFDDVKPTDQLLRLRERAINDVAFPALNGNTGAAGFKPSDATSTPALCISSLNFMYAVRRASSKAPSASGSALSGLAWAVMMNRIVVLLGRLVLRDYDELGAARSTFFGRISRGSAFTAPHGTLSASTFLLNEAGADTPGPKSFVGLFGATKFSGCKIRQFGI